MMKRFSTVIIMFSCMWRVTITCDGREENKLRFDQNGKRSEPLNDQDERVNFWLVTRSSTENSPTISKVNDMRLFNGTYDAEKSTILLVPGFNNTPINSKFANDTRDAYLKQYDGEVIIAYWAKANGNYSEERASIPGVARVVTKFLNRMITEESLVLPSLTVAGHSMGAHIAGTTGKMMKGQITTIIGLDPANPQFVPGSDDVLSTESAGFVQVIHTSNTAEGLLQPVGHADFYVNGEFPPQPGCENLTNFLWTICSHLRVGDLYAESIINNQLFLATKCDSYQKWEIGECNDNEKIVMGQNTSRQAKGKYYLRTAAASPYALGEPGSQGSGRNVGEIQPLDPSLLNSVHFWLVTKQNLESPLVSNVTDEKLFNGTYDPKKVTVVLIPGYGTYPGMSTLVKKLQEVYLASGNVQLIVTYWDAAKGDYRDAVDEFINVGRVIAQFLDRMVSEESLELTTLTVIGHSSGAQIAGTAGRFVSRKFATLVGLDPVGPLVKPEGINVIDQQSAEFVQVIHTSATVLGMFQPIGHADFYVNSGLPPQPGCGNSDFIFPISPTSALCSSARAIELFAESIKNPRAFPAVKCDNHKQFSSGQCEQNPIVFMGQNTTRSAKGPYYLKTRATSPYGPGDS